MFQDMEREVQQLKNSKERFPGLLGSLIIISTGILFIAIHFLMK